MKRIAKPCTLFTTMNHNPADHVRYLLDGHGMAGNAHKIWSKGIKKDAREQSKIAKYWDQIHQEWKRNVAKNAKMTGKQIFVALPNDIQPEEIDKVAKAILKTIPQHHPATLTVHYTSGKENIKNVHLHGVVSMRRGGYGQTNDEYRLNSRVLAKKAVDEALKSCGYTIEENEKKFQVTTRPSPDAVRWIKSQNWTKEQLRNTAFLRRVVLPKATSDKMKQWLLQEMRKADHLKNKDTSFEEALFVGRQVKWRVDHAMKASKEIFFSKVDAMIKKPRDLEERSIGDLKEMFTKQEIETAQVIQEVSKIPEPMGKFGNVGAEMLGGKIAGENGRLVVHLKTEREKFAALVSRELEKSKPAKR